MKKNISKEKLVCSVRIRSIKDSFRKDLIPNTGSISIQERKPNSHEMNMVKWILKQEAIRRVERGMVEDGLKIHHIHIIFMKKKRLIDILEIKERGR